MLSWSQFPMIGWIKSLGILLPLIFFALSGLLILQSGRINVIIYGSVRNWMYALQRLTGLILIPFVAYHLVSLELAPAFSDKAPNANLLFLVLKPAWTRALYLAGTVSAAFFIGNGMATAATLWGMAATRRAREAVAIAGWIVTLVLAVWGVKIVMAFS
jgi:succinate dehydrogenase / fumarate reductase cytochrome b subunit